MNSKYVNKQIQKIKKQLVEKYGAEKIILFGSSIWSDNDKPNDLDFLILKSGVDKRDNRLLTVYKTIEKEMAADFLVYTPEEYSNLIKMGDPFIKKIKERGRVIYG